MATHQMGIVNKIMIWPGRNHYQGWCHRWKNEDMEQLGEEKYQIDTNDKYSPAERDEDIAEASDIETKDL